MKQTIEIEVPYGKKAVLEDNKIVFKDIKPQLPKTWEEFYKNYQNNQYFIDCYSDIQTVPPGYLFNNKDNDKNLLPSEEAAKAHLAFMQLHQLRDCYRQGWKPNWIDEKKKFYISFWNNKKHLVFCSYQVPHFLAFQTEELAVKFFDNFRELIEQAGDLI